MVENNKMKLELNAISIYNLWRIPGGTSDKNLYAGLKTKKGNNKLDYCWAWNDNPDKNTIGRLGGC